jgi:hypothetical protein
MKRPRTHAFWVVALAMGLVVLLRLAAHACPADPTWIFALSDDVDLDDVIHHVLTGTADAPAMPDIRTLRSHFLRLIAADTADGPAAVASEALQTRAPPVRLAPSI